MKPGTTILYRGRTAGATEQTYDWYAKDKEGKVLYFGEGSEEYKNGKVKSTGGSWEAAKDGAMPGIMPASSKVGETYHQEYYEGEAEDMRWANSSGCPSVLVCRSTNA